jgi:PIN domain nuclease of toxin-antitoxin system
MLEAELIVSEVSLLELSIKVSIGKLVALPGLRQALTDNGVQLTGLDSRFLARLELLPLHHRDPFDRFLVAQALVENLHVLTADSRFVQYGARVIDARE